MKKRFLSLVLFMVIAAITVLPNANLIAFADGDDVDISVFGCTKDILREYAGHFVVEDNVLFSAGKTVLIKYLDTPERTEYTVPSDVVRIEEKAFFGSKYLEKINFEGKGPEIICQFSFMGCRKLRSVKIPANVSRIDGFAFNSCKSLSELEFEEDSWLEEIGEYAFCRCGSLGGTIIMPDNIRKVKKYAFAGLKPGTKVVFKTRTKYCPRGNMAFLSDEQMRFNRIYDREFEGSTLRLDQESNGRMGIDAAQFLVMFCPNLTKKPSRLYPEIARFFEERAIPRSKAEVTVMEPEEIKQINEILSYFSEIELKYLPLNDF